MVVSLFSSESIKEVMCKLCHIIIQSTQALRLHLKTAQHRDREDELAKSRWCLSWVVESGE